MYPSLDWPPGGGRAAERGTALDRCNLVIALAVAFATALASAGKRRVTEFDLPENAGSTHEITWGPDGNLWVTQQVQGKIVRITPAGRKLVFTVPDGMHRIILGPGGNMWFTELMADKVGYFKPR
jgi:streptogramin lyase